MKNHVKAGLLCLLATGLLASCNKEEKPYVPQEPELQEDFTETAFGMNLEMVYVKGGEFTMGLTKEQGWNDVPDSTIKKLTRKTRLDSYHIGRYEVTQAQWRAVMGTDARSDYGYGKGDDYPVYYVSWNDAQAFCKKLSEATGKKYVLPTEAQWEYAARGGVHKTKTQFAGSNDIEEVAWYRENSYDLGSDHPDYGTHAVGTKKANALGIYDMSGNVWEWCSDWYMDRYDKADDLNPQGPVSGSYRVWRGGSWSFCAVYCRVSYRRSDFPDHRDFYLGFRVACSSK
ncbi:MAG: formylglycine-generating enzyme family protein [Bacteroides sp.]|nr:formylglycine-generating enzyme family protein [Bacteroides sp.]